jgi:hypothetical protein
MVVVGGLLLVLAVLVAAAAFALYERREQLQAELHRSELLARVLEDHATRSFETASLALAALADVVSRSGDGNGSQLGTVLAQTMVGLPVLRSLALLDTQGRVLASTTPVELGAHIDLQRLGATAAIQREVTGAFVPGRNLLALQRGGSPVATPPGVGFVPVVRQALTRSGEGRLLVATVNPDAIANHLQQVLSEQARSALLANFGGQTLASTSEATTLPGQSVASIPVFRQYLPGTEFGSYVGAGTQAGDQLVSFRASRTRPPGRVGGDRAGGRSGHMAA